MRVGSASRSPIPFGVAEAYPSIVALVARGPSPTAVHEPPVIRHEPSAWRRAPVVWLASGLSASMLLTSCTGEPAAGPEPSASSAATGDRCSAYTAYQGASGTTVTMLAEQGPDPEAFRRTVEDFESCTGIRIVLEVTEDPDAISARAEGGNAPDIGFIYQAFLTPAVHSVGWVDPPVPLPSAAAANLDRWWSPVWKDYGSVDGVVYGLPIEASVKSLVWYSPRRFKAAGYEVPTTWEGLMVLSDTIAESGQKPWCGGLESGYASGWPATDWLEEIVLGTFGPEVYDQWVAHTIPFQSPQIRQAMRTLDAWMRNPEWVNGGFGGVRSVATTAVDRAGEHILDGGCAMLQQAGFYEEALSKHHPEVEVGPDGDVFAFYLPSPDRSHPTRIVGGIGFVVAFSDRPEVADVMTYLSTPEWNTTRAEQGAALSANEGVPLDAYADPIDRLSAELLTRPDTVFRFDASDLMPEAVGADAEWKQLALWFSEGKKTDEVLKAIDEAWPSSS